jgi:Ca-activated chloride channel homolog
MTFEAPGLLALLVIVPVALLAYLLVQRRRARYAVRFTNVDLLADLVPRSPGWRRHVPPALYLLAMTALVIALARPSLVLPVPRDQATVMLALDTSGSMQAKDVSPNRLAAAQQAAGSFVDALPSTVRVGVVAFSSGAHVVVAPTDERKVIHAGIDSLVADGGTAIGDAIVSCLSAVGLAPTAQMSAAMAQNLTGGIASTPPDTALGGAKLGDEAWPQQAPATPSSVEVVLLSDGESTVGMDPLTAAGIAAKAGVPVYTIALGTQGGTVDLPDDNGRIVSVDVSPDTVTLSKIAERTAARFYDAPSSGDLGEIYRTLGSKIGWVIEPQDATQLFAAAGLVFVVLGAGLAALWFNRFP